MQTLHTLLDANLALPPEYRGELTSHLPMALQALHSMGASPARLEVFYQGYARRFQGLAFDAPAHAVQLTRFQDLLARQGREQALAQVVPDLLGGVAAAAFHGVIRTAHAVEAGHTGELAAALAYWAWRWQPLAPPSHPAETRLPFAAWTRSLVAQAPTWRSEGPMIAIRMDEATHSLVYQQLASALEPASDLAERLQALADFAVERYTASGNFTVLHMVTALRALRVLRPWWEGTPGAGAVLTQAVTAAYLAARVVPDAVLAPLPAMGWERVMAAAIASDDDHVIKLVHTCQQEAARAGHDDAGRYLLAATRAVQG